MHLLGCLAMSVIARESSCQSARARVRAALSRKLDYLLLYARNDAQARDKARQVCCPLARQHATVPSVHTLEHQMLRMA